MRFKSVNYNGTVTYNIYGGQWRICQILVFTSDFMDHAISARSIVAHRIRQARAVVRSGKEPARERYYRLYREYRKGGLVRRVMSTKDLAIWRGIQARGQQVDKLLFVWLDYKEKEFEAYFKKRGMKAPILNVNLKGSGS